MDQAAPVSRQTQRFLQFGIALLILISLEGLVIPMFPSPRIGLSVHTLGATQGVLLLGLGALSPRPGGRQRDHHADGRASPRTLARHRAPRERHQSRCVFVGANRPDRVRTRPVGPSAEA
jgi:hypothetical protein